jgi:hypothetical protein
MKVITFENGLEIEDIEEFEVHNAMQKGVINQWEYDFIENNKVANFMTEKQVALYEKLIEKVKSGEIEAINETYVFQFGKYKGVSITMVPLSYLEFCAGNIGKFKNFNAKALYDKHSKYVAENDPLSKEYESAKQKDEPVYNNINSQYDNEFDPEEDVPF